MTEMIRHTQEPGTLERHQVRKSFLPENKDWPRGYKGSQSWLQPCDKEGGQSWAQVVHPAGQGAPNVEHEPSEQLCGRVPDGFLKREGAPGALSVFPTLYNSTSLGKVKGFVQGAHFPSAPH